MEKTGKVVIFGSPSYFAGKGEGVVEGRDLWGVVAVVQGF